MNSLWKAEPTMILAVISAGIALAIGFGAHITTQQMGLLMAFSAAVLGLINRSQVVSPATLQSMTPATLATAQDAAQPVKDTIKKLPVVLLALVLCSGSACKALAPQAPPNLTPQVTAQFYATYAIKDLDVIRDFAVDANKTTPPILSKATLLIIVNWHESLVTVIHATPAGWKAAVLAGLDELKGKLSADDYAKIKPYVDSARIVVMEIA